MCGGLEIVLLLVILKNLCLVKLRFLVNRLFGNILILVLSLCMLLL